MIPDVSQGCFILWHPGWKQHEVGKAFLLTKQKHGYLPLKTNAMLWPSLYLLSKPSGLTSVIILLSILLSILSFLCPISSTFKIKCWSSKFSFKVPTYHILPRDSKSRTNDVPLKYLKFPAWFVAQLFIKPNCIWTSSLTVHLKSKRVNNCRHSIFAAEIILPDLDGVLYMLTHSLVFSPST